jgi:IS5 family transposase
MPTIKPLAQPGLFDQHFRLEELTAMGDPLAKINDIVDWSIFIPVLAEFPKPEPEGPGGRPAYDPLMMFKVLIIQNLYNLSDSQAEFQITDRMSFKRFLGISLADKAPDEKTIWAFHNKIAEHGLAKKLFDVFHRELEAKGMFARKGQMIDASFVEVPRQRNTREENAAIKDGREPEGWHQKSPQFKAQKDMDARWTKKNGISHYGYKNHVKVDSKSKLIDDFMVSEASLHDSQALAVLIKKGDPTTYADSAYTGEECERVFADNRVTAKVIERAYRNKPLTKRQKARNKTKSRVRVRVEHVFGTMVMCMRAGWNRCIGKVRNETAITFSNLVYNMVRFEQIQRLKLCTW